MQCEGVCIVCVCSVRVCALYEGMCMHCVRVCTG